EKQGAQQSITDIQKSVDASLAQQKTQTAFKNSIGSSYSFSSTNVFKSKDSSIGDYSGSLYDPDKKGLALDGVDKGTPIEQINYNGNQYIVTLSGDASVVNGQRTIKNVYSYDPTTQKAVLVSDTDKSSTVKDIKAKFPVFTQSTENTY